MPEKKRDKHGEVQNIYRIVNDGHDDLDLTRAQALATFHQLSAALFPQPQRISLVGGRGKKKRA